MFYQLGLPSVVEERIIASLSFASLPDEVLPCESKSDDRFEASVSMDTSSQTNQDIMQDSETDILADAIVTSEQAECQCETADKEPKLLTDITEEEGDLNENGINETREEMTESSQTVGEDKTSSVSEPNTVITDLGNDKEEAVEELPTRSEGNSRQMLKVIVPKHLLPAIKQISLPSVLLSRCSSSEPVPLK